MSLIARLMLKLAQDRLMLLQVEEELNLKGELYMKGELFLEELYVEKYYTGALNMERL